MERTALMYAEEFRFAVFPCKRRGTQPTTAHGCLDASKDPQAIRKWWQSSPSSNIGIATGAASGVIVLDVDEKTGGRRTLATLEEEHVANLKRQSCELAAAGLHIYFRDPGGLRNSVGRLGPGLDIRADGGYVIAPPSVHQTQTNTVGRHH
jgi:hypothetical protein